MLYLTSCSFVKETIHPFICRSVAAIILDAMNRYKHAFITPGRVLLGILGGSGPPGSPNPDLISDQKKCNFPHPFSDQGRVVQSWVKITQS